MSPSSFAVTHPDAVCMHVPLAFFAAFLAGLVFFLTTCSEPHTPRAHAAAPVSCCRGDCSVMTCVARGVSLDALKSAACIRIGSKPIIGRRASSGVTVSPRAESKAERGATQRAQLSVSTHRRPRTFFFAVFFGAAFFFFCAALAGFLGAAFLAGLAADCVASSDRGSSAVADPRCACRSNARAMPWASESAQLDEDEALESDRESKVNAADGEAHSGKAEQGSAVQCSAAQRQQSGS